ncbi:FAD-dependent oxidoreductase [Mycobacteroides abscessus]|uniref:FAD-dependent oxidoreductase n=1 Tax=Mycobacteroides abscessus TaxID=36809 RepID=UPI0009D27318|nr:FAD-dependent oxidoreductase [Mycobacteroides abscessus]SLG56414.1 amine oxidase [Mycobacteroides abscessus subsp. abscessus]
MARRRPSDVNDEPTFVNSAGPWGGQPEATTRIPNLFLAAAYVRTDEGGVECMESAIEAGRRAADGVLTVADIQCGRVNIPTRIEPTWLKPLAAFFALRGNCEQREVPAVFIRDPMGRGHDNACRCRIHETS